MVRRYDIFAPSQATAPKGKISGVVVFQVSESYKSTSGAQSKGASQAKGHAPPPPRIEPPHAVTSHKIHNLGKTYTPSVFHFTVSTHGKREVARCNL